ncbi:hypothetical protein [Aliihoeflea sp. 2WW]|uniref:hypothetical protein n=1 Tax=Aliihoeflea sp. 2WW TaxID=1381123 RepID=UPI001268E8FC|nr:hypothetical protein [Aliihoeflea sp. 2WW]
MAYRFSGLGQPALMAVLSGLAVMPAASSSQYLKEGEAHALAVGHLLGEPYGATHTEVAQNITSSALVIAGSTPCASVTAPVWSFQIDVPATRHGEQPIRGTLDVDAATGDLVCATLPFL